MTDATVQAHFHGGPFDGESVPVREEDLLDRVTLEETPDGLRAVRPVAVEGTDAGERAVYRLSAEASGLEGDVEYAFVTPLDAAPEG